MQSKSTFSFIAKNAGTTQINAYGLDGKKIIGINVDLLQGKNSFELTLPSGIYTIQVLGNAYTYNMKAISQSTTQIKPTITFSGNTTPNKLQKAKNATTVMAYTIGEQLLYKGISGNYTTIVTDKPTGNKSTNFDFMDCTDADGNHYPIVKIGTQTWLAENLKTTKYRNGELIGTTIPATNDISSTTKKFQWPYNGEEANVPLYGRLYTWYAVKDTRNIAPSGWHVPTDLEWIVLENYLKVNGYNFDGSLIENLIGKSLSCTSYWSTSNTLGDIGNIISNNNKSGFTAMPGGYRFNIATNPGIFNNFGNSGIWWSTEDYTTDKATGRELYNIGNSLQRGNYAKTNACSVRCVKD